MKRNRTCLVTGAAGGIGRALVQVFYDAGFKVIATDIQDKAPLDFPECIWIGADLELFSLNSGYAQDFIHKIKMKLENESLDVLVNNAAVQVLGDAELLTRENWSRTLNVNILAPFFLSQSLCKYIEKVEGCIINIGSIHSRLTKKGFTAYAASKAALASMTRSLAIDWGGRVRVNAIEPAAIASEMLFSGFSEKPEAYKNLANSHPILRVGTPEEVGKLALALVSGGINFIHGACISIDGGIGGLLHDPVLL